MRVPSISWCHSNSAMIMDQVSAPFLNLQPQTLPKGNRKERCLPQPLSCVSEWLSAQQKQRLEEPLLGHHVPPPRVWGLSIPAWLRPDPGELSLGTMVQRRHHQDSHQGWEVKPGRGWPGHCLEGTFLAESAFGGPELLEWHLSSSLPEQSDCFCCHLPSVPGCHRAAELTSISSGQD